MSGRELEEVPCNLCGSRDASVLYDRPCPAEIQDGYAAFAATTDRFEGYGRIVRCAGCGLVFTNPRPNAERLRQGYESCADEDYLGEASSRSINAHLSLGTIRRFVKQGRLLDVGAAAGYFLNAARVDFDVVGLEPSRWACAIAREKFRLECHPESLEQTRRFTPESLDVVSLIDVIEHLSDPKAAVRRCAELLRPGGLLYLVTPDIGSLSARLLRGYWWGLRPAHIFYFDEPTLRRMLAEAGFEVVLAKSFGRIFTWEYWALRLKHYPRPIPSGARAFVRAFGIGEKYLYIDTRDSLELCAVRRS